jgi:phosphate transport system substrate-binding protein
MTIVKQTALLVGVAAVMVSGCGKRAESVTLAGSTAFAPFAEKLGQQFVAQNPGVRVPVQGGGSTVGIQSAQQGKAQIGMADLVKLPKEADGLTSVVVARDGIAVIVNPANRVENLTLDQIRDIFCGKVNNWKDVGGQDGAITLVSREAGSGTRASFEQIVGSVKLSASALVQDSNGSIRETVAGDPKAIGYLSHGLVNDKIKALTVDAQPCSTEAVIAGKYPLVRPIFLLTRGAPQGVTKTFIDFVLSDAGQAQIRKDGLIPAK